MIDEINRLRAENERMTAKLAKAEASAREQVAVAYLAAANEIDCGGCKGVCLMPSECQHKNANGIRALTPADAIAALEARDARVRADERAKVIEEVFEHLKNIAIMGDHENDPLRVVLHIALHTEASREVK